MNKIDLFIEHGLQDIAHAHARREADAVRRKAKQDVKEFYNARRLARRELVLVKYPVINAQTLQVEWHEASFEGRDNANFWIQRHNITGARVINACLAS